MKNRIALGCLCASVVVSLFASVALAAPLTAPLEVYAKHGMVASAHELASQAGIEVMGKGGNAIDAAVATVLALGVVEGNASSIGGSGFAVIRFAKTGEVFAFDYQSSAPASASKEMFVPAPGTKATTLFGGKSIAVPGWLMGMTTLLDKYGRLSFAEVAAPAIRLAEEGFVVDPMQQQIYTDELEKIHLYNEDPSVIPYYPGGLPARAGTLLKQPGLAKTYRTIAEKGRAAFYGGEIGEALVRAANRDGNHITLQDLKDYQLFECTPATSSYRGYKIYAVPPASSGGVPTIQLLNIMENFPIREWGHNTPKTLHYIAESLKYMYLDRARFIADPAFVKIPLDGMSSKGYARLLASKIKPFEVTKELTEEDPFLYEKGVGLSSNAAFKEEHASTSTVSVVDREGNIATTTNSLSFFFGSGVFVPEYGFFLNNTMDNFSKTADSVNAPEPGKRTLSTMSPTLILDPDGRPFMSVGAAGGARIMSAIGQIIMNVIDHGMQMDEAIEQPRIANVISGNRSQPMILEAGISEETEYLLRFRGHDVQRQDKGGFFGTAQAILFDHARGEMNGGADSRRLGVAIGF